MASAASADEALRAAVQVVHEASSRHDWTGIYLMEGDRELVLAHFIGEPSPHVRIPLERGICGAAARERATVIVPDVLADARYLSCSIRTRSEIVVPIMQDGIVLGEIDIDSHTRAAFDDSDRVELEQVAAAIAERLAVKEPDR